MSPDPGSSSPPLSEEALFVAALTEHATQLARTINSPEVIARVLAEWVKQHYPQRVTPAHWITVDGDPRADKGVAIRFFEARNFQASALAGKWSAGAALTTRVWGRKDGASASFGVGVVSPYKDFGAEWRPVAVITIRF